MGNAVNAGADNGELVDNLCGADYIRTARIERILRAVDRGEYILPEHRANAYRDQAWRCNNLHLSAPCIYCEVLEGLGLAPGMSFLNLGSGTGYLSTLVGLILGSNGINHGVEYYEDVVQYANKKLDDFKKYSGARDEFDFCEPTFMQGNCLCLTSERRYDRVYVGAGCPAPFDSYLKNLVKIGGILVMPFHDQLLQVRRESETTFTASSLLPVSFAMLITPKEDSKETFELMDLQPESLQKICRSKIRNILRANVELENPGLRQPASREAKSPRPISKRAKTFIHVSQWKVEDIRSTLEEIESDDDGNQELDCGPVTTGQDTAMNSDRRAHISIEEFPSDNTQTTQRTDTSAQGINSESIAPQLAQALCSIPGVSACPMSARNSATNGSNVTAPQTSSNSTSPSPQQRLKSRKFDSGLGDEDFNDEEETTAESGQAQTKRTKLHWFHSCLKMYPAQDTNTNSINEDTDDVLVRQMDESAAIAVPDSNTTRAASVMGLRHIVDAGDSDSTLSIESDDSDEYPMKTPENLEDYNKRRIIDSPFTSLMIGKINELPLPPTLKSFLNFYRF